MAMSGPAQDVTALLLAWRTGDDEALARLTPLVYNELHRLAHRYMRGEQAEHPLQTTALVNEAYIRLVDSRRVGWQNRAHFFAVAAQLMRRILVDFVRRQRFQKRGGGLQKVSLADGFELAAPVRYRYRGGGRRASGAGEARSSQGPGGGASLFQRTESGRNRGSLECVHRHGWTGLESRQGMAHP